MNRDDAPREAAVPRRALVRARDGPRPRPARPERDGAGAVQRPHRPARQPRRGRAVRHPRAATSTRSTRSARCPTRRPATATRRRGRRSSTSPTASSSGCSSRTSRSTSGTARCTPTSDASTCAPARWTGVTDWTSPAGKRVVVRSTRLVSFVHRGIAAICYEVEAVERTRVIVQSELVANEEVPVQTHDPRVAAALHDPLVAVSQDVEQHGVLLVHRTRASGLTMAAGHGPRDHRAGPGRRGDRRPRGLGAHHHHLHPQARRGAAGREVPVVRLVARSAPPRPSATRRPRR